MFKFQLVRIFFLFQLVTHIAIACQDQCIASIARALAGNYSEKFAPVFKTLSQSVQADGVLPDLSISQIDNLIEPSRQNFYHQAYNHTLAQLISVKERITPESLVQVSDRIATGLLIVARSTMKEAISTIQIRFPVSKSLKKSSLSPSTGSTSPEPGKPISVSTIPLTSNGSRPSFRFRRNIRGFTKDSLSDLVEVPNILIKTSKASKHSFKLRRKILRFSLRDSLNYLVSRTNTNSGNPLAVSTIPVSKTFQIEETPKKVTTEISDRKCTLAVTKEIRVCMPEVLPLFNSLKKRSIILVEKLYPKIYFNIIYQVYFKNSFIIRSKFFIFIQPLGSSRQSARAFNSESFIDHDQILLDSVKLTRINRSPEFNHTPETGLDNILNSLEIQLKEFHQTFVKGPLKEYILSFN